MNNPFSQMITEYGSILPAASYVAGFLGVLFGAIGLRQISVSRLAGEPSTKGYWTFVGGAILTNMWVYMQSISQSFLSTSGTPSALAYASGGSGASSFVPFAIDTVQIIGVFGFIRGAMGLKDDRREGLAIPLGQMFFGTLAANMPAVLHAVGATVGGELQSFIQQIVP